MTLSGSVSSLLRSHKEIPAWPNPKDSLGKKIYFSAISRSLSCWEATGPARRLFDDELAPAITTYIERCTDEFPALLLMTICMIGKTEDTASPALVFTCTHKQTRKEITKMVAECSIMTDENFKAVQVIGSSVSPGMAAPPNNRRRIRLLAGGGGSTHDLAPTSARHEGQPPTPCVLSTSRTLQLGSRLVTSSLDATPGNGRKATAGPVLRIGNDIYFMTVAHVFDAEGNAADAAVVSESDDTDCELDWVGGSGIDSGEEAEIELMSRGSISSDEEPRGRGRSSSTPSSQADEEENSLSSSTTNGSNAPYTSATPSATAQRAIPSTNKDGLANKDTARKDPLQVVGELAFKCSHAGLDYAIIKPSKGTVQIGNYVAISYPHLPRITKLSLTAVGPIPPVKVPIYSLTASSGYLDGVLNPECSYVRLPKATKLQKVYTAILNGAVADGDCGSVIVDQKNGKFYGHIIAGTPGTGEVFIVPAVDILDDIQKSINPEATIALNNDTISNTQSNQMTAGGVPRVETSPDYVVRLDTSAKTKNTIHKEGEASISNQGDMALPKSNRNKRAVNIPSSYEEGSESVFSSYSGSGSSYVPSIFSDAPSSSTVSSAVLEQDQLRPQESVSFLEELVQLFTIDEVLGPVFSETLVNKRIDIDGFLTSLMLCLRLFANGLSLKAKNQLERRTAQFIFSHAEIISIRVGKLYDPSFSHFPLQAEILHGALKRDKEIYASYKTYLSEFGQPGAVENTGNARTMTPSIGLVQNFITYGNHFEHLQDNIQKLARNMASEILEQPQENSEKHSPPLNPPTGNLALNKMSPSPKVFGIPLKPRESGLFGEEKERTKKHTCTKPGCTTCNNATLTDSTASDYGYHIANTSEPTKGTQHPKNYHGSDPLRYAMPAPNTDPIAFASPRISSYRHSRPAVASYHGNQHPNNDLIVEARRGRRVSYTGREQPGNRQTPSTEPSTTRASATILVESNPWRTRRNTPTRYERETTLRNQHGHVYNWSHQPTYPPQPQSPFQHRQPSRPTYNNSPDIYFPVQYTSGFRDGIPSWSNPPMITEDPSIAHENNRFRTNQYRPASSVVTSQEAPRLLPRPATTSSDQERTIKRRNSRGKIKIGVGGGEMTLQLDPSMDGKVIHIRKKEDGTSELVVGPASPTSGESAYSPRYPKAPAFEKHGGRNANEKHKGKSQALKKEQSGERKGVKPTPTTMAGLEGTNNAVHSLTVRRRSSQTQLAGPPPSPFAWANMNARAVTPKAPASQFARSSPISPRPTNADQTHHYQTQIQGPPATAFASSTPNTSRPALPPSHIQRTVNTAYTTRHSQNTYGPPVTYYHHGSSTGPSAPPAYENPSARYSQFHGEAVNEWESDTPTDPSSDEEECEDNVYIGNLRVDFKPEAPAMPPAPEPPVQLSKKRTPASSKPALRNSSNPRAVIIKQNSGQQ